MLQCVKLLALHCLRILSKAINNFGNNVNRLKHHTSDDSKCGGGGGVGVATHSGTQE